jgi:hypothetical protein
MEKPAWRRFAEATLEHLRLRQRPVSDPAEYGLFIDGGVTPHNNPSFALLQMVSLKPFQLCWAPGPQNLSVTSIGTGTFRPRLKYQDLGFTRFPQLAYHALMSLMSDTEVMVLAQCSGWANVPRRG